MATVVDRDEIQAILSKTWNGAMSTAAITAEFFTMMYEEACQNSAPYKHIEESLKFYCPDFEVPKNLKRDTPQKKFTELSKEGNKCHAEELLSTDLASYLNKTVNNKQSKQCNREYQCHRKTEMKLLIQNIKLQKEVIASAYKRKTDELQKQKVDYENQKQKNITLNKKNIELLQLNQDNEKVLKQKQKKEDRKNRQDSNPAFKNYRQNSEPAAFRAIRTVSECLGPNGDAKNGARQQWLAYCKMLNKKSHINSYRSNRFNNLYDGANYVLIHKNDIIDFLNIHICDPNLKLKSVLCELSCEKVYTHIVCLAAIGRYVTSPFWNLVNSNEHYLDLYKFFNPLYKRMESWTENCNIILMEK
ncbi:unnamed protein product [Mytilus edulis]|uniref:Uncharacterized protein n=1 Tax=Mytilus edulis TaxID=6550 RepID=A0A8S3QCK1_MYTED|nr:unnamed protein product [Mytilus edulis]